MNPLGHDEDPVAQELRSWAAQQRAPLSPEELLRVCQAACAGATSVMRSMIRSELRRVFAQELLVFAAGVLIGGAAVWMFLR